ncbi:3-oxoacyl-[acyl-carrier-protein] reductase FabG [Acaryochloris thomasi RCC1774]|uniref:3-oxoacyl-[acyl-carrier-protein] reductase FabG n=1 Tax=Acaryochloris thomasi RCC1774 TaxID=1764569 RepID=A0A2W1JJ64_9CYAN|nr:SDR family NAD(P)-dependent oxidoreductase [Acaryochloris thomasi]PZD73286.1 3-oxoacyl-[acyl-carrier-protein] reductase FabG [Acaryochloris thomasi RCC1774]
MPSQHKTALVTGGNRGIGYAICEGLLKAGFEVILAARSQPKAQAAAEQLHPDVKTLELDVTDDHSIQKAAETLTRQIERLDVLINNAGIYPDEGVNILTISRELLDQTMNTNAFSPVKITQTFLPLLEKSDSAKVINMSSGYGALDGLSANVPSYCLSKLALNGATIMLANALRPKQIGVYAMSPGWVATDMGGESAPRSPEQGADTAVWLATEATLAMTGKFFSDRIETAY